MTTQTKAFEQFLRGYTAALLWSSTIEADGTDYTADQLPAADQLDQHCRCESLAFFEANRADIDAAALAYDRSHTDGADTGYDLAGHDFALTRNGHGAGYWDGDLPEELGARLTAAAQAAGQVDIYLGDDETVYASGGTAWAAQEDKKAQYRQYALGNLATDELGFDEDARVTLGDDAGAWVQAWAWLPESSL